MKIHLTPLEIAVLDLDNYLSVARDDSHDDDRAAAHRALWREAVIERLLMATAAAVSSLTGGVCDFDRGMITESLSMLDNQQWVYSSRSKEHAAVESLREKLVIAKDNMLLEGRESYNIAAVVYAAVDNEEPVDQGLITELLAGYEPEKLGDYAVAVSTESDYSDRCLVVWKKWFEHQLSLYYVNSVVTCYCFDETWVAVIEADGCVMTAYYVVGSDDRVLCGGE
jgi:hypothetical protein